jgi:hypothetical protein
LYDIYWREGFQNGLVPWLGFLLIGINIQHRLH